MKRILNSPIVYAVKIVFKSSFLYSFLLIIHTIIIGAMPSILVVLEANFIDKSIALLKTGFDINKMIVPILYLVVVITIMWLAKTLKGIYKTLLLSAVRNYLLPQIYDKKASLDYKDYENIEICNLIRRVSKEPELTVTNTFVHLLLFVSDLIVVVSLFILIATYTWKTALSVFVISLPLFLLAMKSGKSNYEAMKETIMLERKGQYFDMILCDKNYVNERSLFQFGKEINERCYENNERIRKVLIVTRLKWFLKMKVGSIIIALISFSITLFLLNPLSNRIITIGLFASLVNAIFKLVNKLSWELTDVIDSLAKKSEYLKDLKTFNQLRSVYSQTIKKVREKNIFKSIEFKNVSFKYPNSDEYVLENISFKIEANKHYALIGINGAGKTTIIKLIVGLYNKYDGEILINNININKFDQNEIKELYSVVFQDFAKYQISIKDNIILPVIQDLNNDEIDERLEDVIKKLDMSNIIVKAPMGVETELGKLNENAIDLSHGQWQRIAIARAIIKDAPVYILDEPCSALDAISEQKLYLEYDNLLKDKTTISITHRLGATKMANEIIVISEGKVIATGTHRELYVSCDLYKDMYDKQKGWYENEK